MRVDIYLLAAHQQHPTTARELVCKLVGKAWPGYQRIAVCCPEQDQQSLDELLWQLPSERFIAHGIVGSEAAVAAPVVISGKPENAGLLINLQPGLAGDADLSGYARILDIVGVDAAAKTAGRARYRRYQQYTRNINVHQL